MGDTKVPTGPAHAQSADSDLDELINQIAVSEGLRQADNVLIRFDDLLPSLRVGNISLPLVSDAFEGLRYLQNKFPDHAKEYALRLFNVRKRDLRMLQGMGAIVVVNGQYQRQIEWGKKQQELEAEQQDVMGRFAGALVHPAEIYANFTSGKKHPDAGIVYNTLQERLFEVVERAKNEPRTLHHANRITEEDVRLFAAAYDRATMVSTHHQTFERVVVVNSNPGAEWLYQRSVAQPAIDATIRLLKGPKLNDRNAWRRPERELELAPKSLYITHDFAKEPLRYGDVARQRYVA